MLAGDSATYGDSAIDTCIGEQSTTGVTGFTKLGNCVGIAGGGDARGREFVAPQNEKVGGVSQYSVGLGGGVLEGIDETVSDVATSASTAVSTSVNSESGDGGDVVDVRGVRTGKGVGELR